MPTADSVLDAINTISSRPYNWDGQRGLPARPDSVELAGLLVANGSLHVHAMPSAALASLSKAGVVILSCAPMGHKALVLKFVCGNVVEYTKAIHGHGDECPATIQGTARFPSDEDGFLRGANELNAAIAWLSQ